MSSAAEIINDTIRSRRSIFPPSYIEKEIPVEIINTILENANYAPTHKLTEPWRFIVFKGDSRNRLAGFFSERYRTVTSAESFSQARYDAAGDKVLKSNCVIAINAELHPEKLPEWEETAAVACAVQNMWLTATAYGIGSYWSSPAILKELGLFLELPENQKCLGLFFMGYHDAAEVPARRTPVENKVTWAE
ncbi:nitroreductase family protein [Dyadobacter psychrotolerans]|uniref:Nitroreductase n=1 Tax=Dyadobacter psychrotolerans TaxID=2541721 RepID=A0A4R5E0E6_9BACT|nr:nitroreductase [Dyadobacter psychrotolerans]TDE18320.1 nitroreductase [Dyadobacter psychrotolerans]